MTDLRVVVLGGAGDMGRRATLALATRPEVAQLTVADLNVGAARRLADTLGGPPRVVVQPVDATDRDQLVAAVRGHDVAVGAIGPFFRFELPLVQAALAAGVDYVSLCDDHDAAHRVLQCDDAARAAGRRVVTGLGWTPGLSNILARRGYELLDRTDAVDIAWCGAAADARGAAVVLHTLHIFTGQVPSFVDGRPVLVPAGSGRLRRAFPPPLGDVDVVHVGHPEPITIPRHLAGVQRVTLRGGIQERLLHRLALTVSRLPCTQTPAGQARVGRLVAWALPWLQRLGPAAVPCSGLRVDVSGHRGDRPWQLSFTAVGRMEDLTALPLAVGALMLGRGQVLRLGVMAPEAEGAIAPAPFLVELAAMGVQVAMHEGPQGKGDGDDG